MGTKPPEYQKGDSVGWIGTPMLSAGIGMIVDVLQPRADGTAMYKVAKLVRGRATGVELEIPEDRLYRTRHIDDGDPIPEALS